MRKQVSIGRGALLSRVAILTIIGGLAAACSDSSRFARNPFSNPFSDAPDVEQTASITPRANPQYQAPSYSSAQPVPVVSSQPIQPVANVAGGGWTAAGGTSITIAQGDNLNSISNRYGVPTNAILSANGMTSAAQVEPGRSIVIPVYNVNAASASRVAPASGAAAPAVARAQSSGLAPVKAKPPLPPVIAKGKAVEPVAPASAHTLNNPKQMADAKLVAGQKTAQGAVQKPVVAGKQQVEQAKATVKPQVPVVAASAEVAKPTAVAPKDADQTASLPSADKSTAEFRWPAKGRVISGFGSGGNNEGINISLPEGTPVRATETGTVTFAGDDVKSYGNLVLIKHDNGYISAYAHNGTLNVKRGERVTRGQVIAKSGQSGDVTSPQLHFEIRKGPKPVDPVPYLGG